ncbi:MAG: lysostaphin resistance A-like protein [Elusimicrobiota bacterium]
MKKRVFIRSISTALAIIYFATNCAFAHNPKKSVWAERRRSVDNKKSIQLAQLPSNVALENSHSILQQLPHVQASLPRQFEESVPKDIAPQLSSLFQNLSTQYGTIQEITLPSPRRGEGQGEGKNGRIVIHIQDVHRNAEAQKNIGKTIQGLIDGNQVDLIALEGAFNPIDLNPFRVFPPEATRKVANYLLRENKVSGPIYTGFTLQLRSGQTLPRFIGVDDSAHYKANVEAYRQSASHIEKNKQQLNELRTELAQKKKTIFNAALYDFDCQVELYRGDTLSLGKYVEFLSSFKLFSKKPVNDLDPGLRRGDDTDKGFNEHFQIQIFLKAIHLESRLNFAAVERERGQLLSQLLAKLGTFESQSLIATSVAYRLGNISHADFYARLKNLCDKKEIALSRYPAMNSYLQYVLLSDQINADDLFKSIEKMEESIYSSLANTDVEKQLIKESHALSLTKKLVDFSLTKEEWGEYINSSPRFSVGREGGEGFALESFENFYKQAEIRDEKMASNFLKIIENSNTKYQITNKSPKLKKSIDHCDLGFGNYQNAVLVTGGFHSAGIDQRLSEAGYTVISFTPKITKVNSENGSSYLTVFAQEKTPLDQLFEGEKLFLAEAPIPSSQASIFALYELVKKFSGFAGKVAIKFPRGVLSAWFDRTGEFVKVVYERRVVIFSVGSIFIFLPFLEELIFRELLIGIWGLSPILMGFTFFAFHIPRSFSLAKKDAVEKNINFVTAFIARLGLQTGGTTLIVLTYVESNSLVSAILVHMSYNVGMFLLSAATSGSKSALKEGAYLAIWDLFSRKKKEPYKPLAPDSINPNALDALNQLMMAIKHVGVGESSLPRLNEIAGAWLEAIRNKEPRDELKRRMQSTLLRGNEAAEELLNAIDFSIIPQISAVLNGVVDLVSVDITNVPTAEQPPLPQNDKSREFILHETTDVYAQLIAIYPWLKDKIEKIVKTPFSKLKLGVDYDRRNSHKGDSNKFERSLEIDLPDVVMINGFPLKTIKVKGGTLENAAIIFDPAERLRREGLVPAHFQPGDENFTPSGIYYTEEYHFNPLYGLNFEDAVAEFLGGQALLKKGFLTPPPLCLYELPGDTTPQDRSAGMVVLGLPPRDLITSSIENINNQFSKYQPFTKEYLAANAPERENLRKTSELHRVLEKINNDNGLLYKRLAERGIVHMQLYRANYGTIKINGEELPFIWDAESIVLAEHLTPAQFFGFVLQGLGNCSSQANSITLTQGQPNKISQFKINWTGYVLHGFFDFNASHLPIDKNNLFPGRRLEKITPVTLPLYQQTRNPVVLAVRNLFPNLNQLLIEQQYGDKNETALKGKYQGEIIKSPATLQSTYTSGYIFFGVIHFIFNATFLFIATYHSSVFYSFAFTIPLAVWTLRKKFISIRFAPIWEAGEHAKEGFVEKHDPKDDEERDWLTVGWKEIKKAAAISWWSGVRAHRDFNKRAWKIGQRPLTFGNSQNDSKDEMVLVWEGSSEDKDYILSAEYGDKKLGDFINQKAHVTAHDPWAIYLLMHSVREILKNAHDAWARSNPKWSTSEIKIRIFKNYKLGTLALEISNPGVIDPEKIRKQIPVIIRSLRLRLQEGTGDTDEVVHYNREEPKIWKSIRILTQLGHKTDLSAADIFSILTAWRFTTIRGEDKKYFNLSGENGVALNQIEMISEWLGAHFDLLSQNGKTVFRLEFPSTAFDIKNINVPFDVVEEVYLQNRFNLPPFLRRLFIRELVREAFLSAHRGQVVTSFDLIKIIAQRIGYDRINSDLALILERISLYLEIFRRQNQTLLSPATLTSETPSLFANIFNSNWAKRNNLMWLNWLVRTVFFGGITSHEGGHLIGGPTEGKRLDYGTLKIIRGMFTGKMPWETRGPPAMYGIYVNIFMVIISLLVYIPALIFFSHSLVDYVVLFVSFYFLFANVVVLVVEAVLTDVAKKWGISEQADLIQSKRAGDILNSLTGQVVKMGLDNPLARQAISQSDPEKLELLVRELENTLKDKERKLEPEEALELAEKVARSPDENTINKRHLKGKAVQMVLRAKDLRSKKLKQYLNRSMNFEFVIDENDQKEFEKLLRKNLQWQIKLMPQKGLFSKGKINKIVFEQTMTALQASNQLLPDFVISRDLLLQLMASGPTQSSILYHIKYLSLEELLSAMSEFPVRNLGFVIGLARVVAVGA